MALTRFSYNLAKASFKLCPRQALKLSQTQLLKPTLSTPANRMFTTSKVLSKEQIEELQANPYFDKYAEKIAKLQKYN